MDGRWMADGRLAPVLLDSISGCRPRRRPRAYTHSPRAAGVMCKRQRDLPRDVGGDRMEQDRSRTLCDCSMDFLQYWRERTLRSLGRALHGVVVVLLGAIIHHRDAGARVVLHHRAGEGPLIAAVHGSSRRPETRKYEEAWKVGQFNVDILGHWLDPDAITRVYHHAQRLQAQLHQRWGVVSLAIGSDAVRERQGTGSEAQTVERPGSHGNAEWLSSERDHDLRVSIRVLSVGG
mmetsp:Transcript_7276/g.10237  ORF Transcript_7276/g.10237 Transcript_7276/m.10237 type:complete len:234 (-) Transcript_7276:1060-1761(-)